MKSFLRSRGKRDESSTQRPQVIVQSGHNSPHDESNWLVSYADMMTLLCGFFILLFSMAKLDEPKYESLKHAISKQFGGQYQSPTEEFAKHLRKTLEELGLEKQASVQSDSFGVSIVFQSTLFFDTLSAEVKPEGQKILEGLIDSINTKQIEEGKQYKIIVEGHTDGRPILSGIYPSNWELSGARASQVIRIFLSRGFVAKRLAAIGYADTYAQAHERTPSGELDPEALAKNRRVVVRILSPSTEAIPLPTSGHQDQI